VAELEPAASRRGHAQRLLAGRASSRRLVAGPRVAAACPETRRDSRTTPESRGRPAPEAGGRHWSRGHPFEHGHGADATAGRRDTAELP
jgi:hypothetical protein